MQFGRLTNTGVGLYRSETLPQKRRKAAKVTAKEVCRLAHVAKAEAKHIQ